MTSPDLNLVERQLIAAVKGIDAGEKLSSWFSDTDDVGRNFSMRQALEHAAQSLRGECSGDELALMDRAFAKVGIKRKSSDKGKIAGQLLQHLDKAGA